jgi:hypothetical protein
MTTLLGRLKPLMQGEHYNCGIILTDVDFGSAEAMAATRRNLGVDARNPKISLELDDCAFEIPLTEISVIVVGQDELQDPTLKHIMLAERIEKIAESDRRVEIQDVVSTEVAKLEQYDLSDAVKHSIFATVDRMMWQCLQDNMARDAGPEPLANAVRLLFNELSVKQMTAQLASEASSWEGGEDGHRDAGSRLSWRQVPRRELEADLLGIVDKALAAYRALQVEDDLPRSASPGSMPMSGTAPMRPASRAEVVSEQSEASDSEMGGKLSTIAAALAKLGPNGLQELMVRVERAAMARLEKGQQRIDSFFPVTAPSRTVAFHDASERGDLRKVAELLALPTFNPTSPNRLGQTPLHLAAMNRHDDVFMAIARHKKGGAGLAIRNAAGQTPLHLAAGEDLPVLVDFVAGTFERESDGDASLNARDDRGRTPLATAVDRGAHEAVRALVALSAVDIAAADKNGKTPCHLALERQDRRTLSLLLDSGKVSIEQRAGLVSLAMQRNEMELAGMLLSGAIRE